jgi:hypothetical protein
MSRPRRTLALFSCLLAGILPLFLRGTNLHFLAGRVVDERGPVSGARVRYRGQCEFVLTDARGRFRLPAPTRAGADVTAGKEGYFIAGSPAGRRPLSLALRRLPADDCEAYAWVDPTPDPAAARNCGNCHADIYREWAGSGHARAAQNRRFRNLFDGGDWHGRRNVGWNLLADHPDGAGVCTACHAPTVPFRDPAYYNLRQARGVAARGVHCDYCHKVSDAIRENIGLTHGRFGLKLVRPAEGQLAFGPLDDVDRGEDSYSPLYRESRYCASCHEGTIFGVHVYGTYSEWLDSPARRDGKQCQTCHMAPTGLMTNLAPGKGGIRRDPGTLASHHFPGGQAEMLRRCLKVAVALSRDKGEVRARVVVRADGVGHRVPTGFVDRNLVLVVEPLGTDGQPLLTAAGPRLPAAAGRDLAGRPGRLFAKLLKDFDGHSPSPFWRAQPEAADTRLFPGRADVTEFYFPAAAARVRVRLLYRRFWPEVAASKGWPENETTVVDETVAFCSEPEA